MTFDKFIFANRFACITVFLVLLQQSTVASATYFLTQLMLAFQSEQAFDVWLYAYCIAMVVPYVPGCLGHIALQKWVNTSHETYVSRAVRHMRSFTGKQVTQSQREFMQTLVGKQALAVISDVLHFFHGFLDFLASSLFNVLVLAWLLPGDLALGYAVSTAACLVALAALRGPINRLAQRQEVSQIEMAAHLTRAWDNTVIGNALHRENWSKTNKGVSDRFYTSAMRLRVTSSLGNILLAMLTLLPTIFLIVATLGDSSLQPVVAAALIANLTRIFHVLSGVTALAGQAISCSANIARARVLFDGWPSPPSTGEAQQSWAVPLAINGTIVSTHQDGIGLLVGQTSGRFTIRAPNGAGKSTFLIGLKRALADRAFYLPAHAEGLVWNSPLDGLSTGERMLSHLAEVAVVSGVTHLLLDEWDANLDDANTERMNEQLDVLARSRVLVEVRH